ncbi:tryptophan-rich sensory protein [Sphingomonas sp. BK580]|uniref:tryptophan-rich sensory protein n=1 Tax=Sphingomonas sp. BK580 TaxID=2586972 RepID=UPI00161E221C|nr:tryptophan-rich sensory protein [Sphingomonas sp. BK580]MBB3691809.1 2-polyprenyl-6-methoxyphenol hydroxylase-like FAD-dependent oxidoreductase/tryptophan-rich sensory protein [Sphingomonas sp. BK580]
MSSKVLITGASVAGNTVAWWLERAGFDVTVVERAPAFRDGGQNVDVRGVGRAVMRQMGLEEAALAQGTGEEGTAWVEADGRIAAQFLTDDLGRDGPTAEMEILRGDLASLLYDGARERARYRFDDHVVAIDQDEEAAEVSFAGGTRERYDAVIVAEGVGSATRELVFPGENRPRWMDMTIAYFTIPRAADDDRLWRWYHAPGGRSVSLRPDRHGTTRAMLTVQKPPEGEQEWDGDRQKAWLAETFADAGWQAPRVLAGMRDTADFYLDVLRQVRMERWSSGRVALCGDSAWCVTPLGGVGTTLAVTGARVLAGELTRARDVPAALAAYERAMRPMVEKAQGVPKLAPRLANPHSRLGIRLLHAAMALASQPAVSAVTGRLFGGGDEAEPDLSRYPPPGVTEAPRASEAADAAAADPGGWSPVAALGLVGLVLGASAVLGRRNAPDRTHPAIRRWYQRLDKPDVTPPDAVFGAVWPALEVGLAIGGYRLLRRPASGRRNAAVALWLANSAMIGGWSELFFRRQRLGASAAASGAMLASGTALVATAARVDRTAAMTALPYAGWLGFATLLAERIRRDNPARGR